MPKQKDLKRIVRSRMQKTGESYTAARAQVLRKKETPPDYAALAGMSDAALTKQTGRTWADWVRLLDAAGSADKPHREIARYVASLGVPSWWSQSVTVGYERIRGLRAMGQRRGGGYEAHKSRTFAVPVERLFAAFENSRFRKRWLPERIRIASATAHKRMRLTWDDGTPVEIGFIAKKPDRGAITVQHRKLADRPAAERMKALWGERLDTLATLLG